MRIATAAAIVIGLGLGACGSDVNTHDVYGTWQFTYDSQFCGDSPGERWTSEIILADGQPPEREGNTGGELRINGQFVEVDSLGNDGAVLYVEFTLGDDPIGVVDWIHADCEIINEVATVEKLTDG